MRTRFLNTNYSAPPSSTARTFLKLPIPNLSHLPPYQEETLVHFPEPLEDASLLGLIERLPIQEALSNFLYHVLPRNINYQDSEDAPFSFEPDLSSHSFSQKDDDTCEPGELLHDSKLLQFEVSEPLEFLDSVCLPAEGFGFLRDVAEVEQPLDWHIPEIDIEWQEEIHRSLDLLENDNLDYCVDQRASIVEFDDSSLQEKACSSFLLLEVDEISLRNCTYTSAEDEFLSFLEGESLWDRDENFLIDGTMILGSMEYDILDLFNCCLAKNSAESELVSSDALPGKDTISLVNVLQITENPGEHIVEKIVFFGEVEFLDEDFSELYDAFLKMEKLDGLEACEWIFREDIKLNIFNRLIVSKELALADDIFRSLPVPIISDDDKIMSICRIFKDAVVLLNPLSYSAADEIYLDWHLLGEDPCNCNIISPFDNMLEALDLLGNDFHWESSVDGSWLTDLIFSDDVPNGVKNEEYENLSNFLSEGALSSKRGLGASSSLLNDKCNRAGDKESLDEEKAPKASLLFKYMSKFNDLDFFLNPGKASVARKCGSADDTTDTKAKIFKEGESHSSPRLLENAENCLDQVQNLGDVAAKCNSSSEAADGMEVFCMPIPAPFECPIDEAKKSQGSKLCLPETVIIVNTHEVDKEMIVSRRSTYQRILSLEKEGVQVVERDLELPIDVVVSSALCLVWYDHRIIEKSTASPEASSCLPACIENIAMNVLTSLSFCFSGCILVFEGEFSFLCIVMESSDVIYAAAASLGMDLQLFYSHSAELTSEIMLSSISYASKMYRSLYPKMFESETLAESFLTCFPSINPLTAHAILSSECLLFQFLELSHERRICALQRYHVPEESIALFSAVCRYGEREDSKSIMTDCSSSVSSGPDSDKTQFSLDIGNKRRKRNPNVEEMDMHANDIWNSELTNADGIQNPCKAELEQDFWKSMDFKILDEPKPPFSSSERFCNKKDIIRDAWMMDSYSLPEPHGSSKGLCSNEIKRPSVSLDDRLFRPNFQSEISSGKRFDQFTASKSENLHGDLTGEVLDLNDFQAYDNDIPSVANHVHSSPWLREVENNPRRRSRATRKLSFGEDLPTFPSSAETNTHLDGWTAARDQTQSFQEKNNYPDEVTVPMKQQKRLLEDACEAPYARSSKGLLFNMEMPCHRTPLSKAINSSHQQPGSPWTIEFLNRIREKSLLRKQSLPPAASSPVFGYLGNVSNMRKKRRSPSILEFFKYQGGGTPRKLQEQKKQKQHANLSSLAKCERASASQLQTFTPVDKRAKQTLSFTTNGSGSQTKLVWSDGSVHRLPKKFKTFN